MYAVEESSRSATTTSDELVPSRYALRVGQIDVMVISDGVFPLPASTLATNADPKELAAWLDYRMEAPDTYCWPLNVLVLKSGGRTVLVDAGMGAEYPGTPRAGGLLASRMKAAGIDPASVTDVVLTHLHVDHVGGLLADDGLRGRLRSDVRIHVAAADIDFWTSPDFSRNTFGGMPEVLQSAAKRFLDEYGGRLRPFDTEHIVAPGIRVQRTGGHTPGHSVVRLASGDERMTFLGDAVFPDHFDRPDWYNAFDHDPEEAVRVRTHLMRELAETREPLLATHLPFPSVGKVAVAGNAFRYVPGEWRY